MEGAAHEILRVAIHLRNSNFPRPEDLRVDDLAANGGDCFPHVRRLVGRCHRRHIERPCRHQDEQGSEGQPEHLTRGEPLSRDQPTRQTTMGHPPLGSGADVGHISGAYGGDTHLLGR